MYFFKVKTNYIFTFFIQDSLYNGFEDFRATSEPGNRIFFTVI